MGRARALLAACHPLPSVAVTAFAGAYALGVGLPLQRFALLVAAVLTGQLSIGWCNDAVDAVRDRSAGRRDKPLATGAVGVAVAWRAAAVALLACAGLSLLLGLPATLVHLGAVICGWLYDLGVKATVASGLPYLLAFGLLPGVATWALPGPGWPPAAVVVGAGLLGLAAHFANTVGDEAADAATGVRGLPQRIGPARSLVMTAVLVGAAGASLLAGAPHRGPVPVTVLVLGVAVAAAGALLVGRGRDLAFRLTLVAVTLVIAGFLLASH
jgi:4-hydroxybenzoate polyprenyltransferase